MLRDEVTAGHSANCVVRGQWASVLLSRGLPRRGWGGERSRGQGWLNGGQSLVEGLSNPWWGQPHTQVGAARGLRDFPGRRVVRTPRVFTAAGLGLIPAGNYDPTSCTVWPKKGGGWRWHEIQVRRMPRAKAGEASSEDRGCNVPGPLCAREPSIMILSVTLAPM